MWEDILRKGAKSKMTQHAKNLVDEVMDETPRNVREILDLMYKKLEEKNRSKREDTNKKDFIRTGKNLIPTSSELHRYLVRNYQSIRISKITGERVNNNSGERHYFR